MRIGSFAVALAVLASAYACAEDSEFQVRNDGAAKRGVVVSLPWDEPVPQHGVTISIGSEAGIPATIRDGSLYFVLDSIDDNATLVGTVDVTAEKPNPQVTVEEDGDHRLRVSAHGEHVSTYHYAPDQRKPFLWPVHGADEITVTRDYPMGPRVKTRDHEHHESLWSAYGNLNGADFWEYNERTGWQVTQDIDWNGGAALGWIRASNVWVDADREPVIEESREYRFYAGDPTTRFFELDVSLTAAFGDVNFGDTKEGGMIALRLRDALRERGGNATMTNSEGGVGADQIWGKPARWVDYSGPIGDHGVRGVAIFDHPSSFRHPTYWHARDYGLVGANAFGYSDFTGGELNGDYLLKNGDSITFRYRVFLHNGTAEEAKVAEHYAGFAEPVTAWWSK